MSAIGTVVSRHRNNALLSLMVIGLGIALLACAFLLFYVRDRVDPAAATTLHQAIVALAIAGPLAIVLGVFLRRGGWELGEYGIRRLPDSAEGTFLFSDLAETAQFYRAGLSVHLGWRRRNQEKWYGANGNVSGYYKLLDRFMHGYIAARLPAVLDKLNAGGSETFRVASLGGALQRQFKVSLNSFAKVPTEALTVSRHRISYEGNEINVADIVAIDRSAWTSRLSFQLRSGSKVSVNYTLIFDGPLLIALLDQLVPAPAGAP
ncbi:hypothetical protein HF319_06175 [Xanthomonas sp. Kuri4-1]